MKNGQSKLALTALAVFQAAGCTGNEMQAAAPRAATPMTMTGTMTVDLPVSGKATYGWMQIDRNGISLESAEVGPARTYKTLTFFPAVDATCTADGATVLQEKSLAAFTAVAGGMNAQGEYPSTVNGQPVPPGTRCTVRSGM
jgi:hypothetical protein